MCKKFLRLEQKMTMAVTEAKGWVGAMLQREARGSGDLNNAMDRLARRHHLPRATLWSLRYRPPKDIFASTYFAIRAAYEAETIRQAGILKHEIEITQAKDWIDTALVSAAISLAGAEETSQDPDGQAGRAL